MICREAGQHVAGDGYEDRGRLCQESFVTAFGRSLANQSDLGPFIIEVGPTRGPWICLEPFVGANESAAKSEALRQFAWVERRGSPAGGNNDERQRLERTPLSEESRSSVPGQPPKSRRRRNKLRHQRHELQPIPTVAPIENASKLGCAGPLSNSLCNQSSRLLKPRIGGRSTSGEDNLEPRCHAGDEFAAHPRCAIC